MLYIITFIIYLKKYANKNITLFWKNTAISSQSHFWKSIKTKLSWSNEFWTFYKCPFFQIVAISFLCLFSVKLFKLKNE